MIARSTLTLAALCLVFSSTAHAGPIELFTDVVSEPGKPDLLTLKYQYGGGGFFFSDDAGAHFRLLCSVAIDASVRDSAKLYVNSTDKVYLGLFEGLWQGDKNGCGWHKVPALDGKWVAALAGDPFDAAVVYLVTSNGGAPNGMFVNDGQSADWTPLGDRAELFINTLHIVKKNEGRRFYETAVKSVSVVDPGTGKMTSMTHYVVRVSDDDAKTWTDNEFGAVDQFGPKNSSASMQLLAVDPTNPDNIVASVVRDMDVDDLVYSPARGEAGSWVLVGQVSKLQAVAFSPDGKLYYGDYDQASPGFFEVAKLGDRPKQLSTSWKVGCLKYDVPNSRMYACKDWQFGTANLTTGAFESMLDMRTAEKFVDCPGEAPIADRCQRQLLDAYCGLGHYPDAPLCSGYDRPWYEPDPTLGGAAGATSAAGSSAAKGGSGGGGGSKAGRSGSMAGAGNAGSGGKSGCSCAVPGSADGGQQDGLLGTVAVAALALRLRRARSRRRVAS